MVNHIIFKFINIADHNMSDSEEMYLVSLARLKEAQPSRPVPMARLAKQMQVLPVSANQMIRKLEEAGLVSYQPYKGVELTGSGWQQARYILRHRRLWEVFLVEKLHLTLSEADALSCKLEHVTPVEAAERLADFLGRPERSPGGKIIPPAQGGEWVDPGIALPSLQAGESGQVMRIEAELPSRSYLTSEGILAGASLSVWGIGKAGAMFVRTGEGKMVHLSAELAGQVYVTRME